MFLNQVIKCVAVVIVFVRNFSRFGSDTPGSENAHESRQSLASSRPSQCEVRTKCIQRCTFLILVMIYKFEYQLSHNCDLISMLQGRLLLYNMIVFFGFEGNLMLKNVPVKSYKCSNLQLTQLALQLPPTIKQTRTAVDGQIYICRPTDRPTAAVLMLQQC